MKTTIVTFAIILLSCGIYYSEMSGADVKMDNANVKVTPVILTVGDKTIKAVIYDNRTGRDVLSKLPYTITLHRYEMDYCGTLDAPLAYDEKDKHDGWKNGDIDLAGSYFSILFDGEEKSQSYKEMITFGRIEEDLPLVKGLGGSITVTVTLAE